MSPCLCLWEPIQILQHGIEQDGVESWVLRRSYERGDLRTVRPRGGKVFGPSGATAQWRRDHETSRHGNISYFTLRKEKHMRANRKLRGTGGNAKNTHHIVQAPHTLAVRVWPRPLIGNVTV
jgi:hypothetical protein